MIIVYKENWSWSKLSSCPKFWGPKKKAPPNHALHGHQVHNSTSAGTSKESLCEGPLVLLSDDRLTELKFTWLLRHVTPTLTIACHEQRWLTLKFANSIMGGGRCWGSGHEEAEWKRSQLLCEFWALNLILEPQKTRTQATLSLWQQSVIGQLSEPLRPKGWSVHLPPPHPTHMHGVLAHSLLFVNL